jgi:hypothetical protein
VQGRQLARFDVELRPEITPHHSQLHFTKSGQLFAKLKDGKTKRLTLRGDPPLELLSVDAPPGDAAAIAGPEHAPKTRLPDWELLPHGPGGRYLVAAVPSCERSEVQLAFGRKSGAALPSVPLSVLAPRPGNCKRFIGFQIAAEVIGWDGGQLAILLGGELLWTSGVSKGPPEPIAWGSPLGLLTQTGDKLTRFVKDGKSEDMSELHHCVVAAQKRRIACVKGPSVYVFEEQE